MDGVFSTDDKFFGFIVMTAKFSKGFCEAISVVKAARTDMSRDCGEGNDGDFSWDFWEGFVEKFGKRFYDGGGGIKF